MSEPPSEIAVLRAALAGRGRQTDLRDERGFRRRAGGQRALSGVAAALSDATNNGMDALINLFTALRQGYRTNARFIMNRNTTAAVRKLKNADGDYLWQPSNQVGQPPSLLGYPASDDDNMPNIGANAFPIAFGDFARGYLIVDRAGVRALEPHLDAATMELHHTKHHQAYVNGLNTALAELGKIRAGAGDAALIKHWSRELAFHGGGHVNHALFWLTMAPPGQGGGGEPTGALGEAIARDFGSFAAFADQFQKAAIAVEGAGWGWLVYDQISGRLLDEAGKPISKGHGFMPLGVSSEIGHISRRLQLRAERQMTVGSDTLRAQFKDRRREVRIMLTIVGALTVLLLVVLVRAGGLTIGTVIGSANRLTPTRCSL